MQVPNPPIGVAVIGMPRSGSTIVTALLNSFNRAAVLGEPHRSFGKPTVTEFTTRHGSLALKPQIEVLGQIEGFAAEHGLNLFGFKEVLDPLNQVFPIELVEDYADRLDYVFVTIRNPRRNYSSLVQLGHARSLKMSPSDFVTDYGMFIDAVIDLIHPQIVPVILEKFRVDPLGHIGQVTGWPVSGTYQLKAYAGGGDPHAQVAATVERHDYRPPYAGAELDEADDYYNEALQLIGP